MKKIILVSVLLLFTGSACNTASSVPPTTKTNNSNQQNVDTVYIEKKQDTNNSFEIILNADKENKTIAELTSVYNSHYHYFEYNKTGIYILRRIETASTSTPFSDELWRYDYQGNGEKIYEKFGLDFRITPNDNYILITADRNDPIEIINNKGTVLHSFQLKNMADPFTNGSTINGPQNEWDEQTKKFKIEIITPSLVEESINQNQINQKIILDPATGVFEREPKIISSLAP